MLLNTKINEILFYCIGQIGLIVWPSLSVYYWSPKFHALS
jgi:hypothetical protein